MDYYIKGGISGMIGILLSHPIDTIKTYVQTGKSIPNYNLKTLYKGFKPPLIGVGIEKAIVFGTYNKMMEITKGNIPLSGGVAGLIASVIVSPYERLKILKQNGISTGLRDCLKPSFIFKGLGTTMTRETPGFAIYFSVYEYLKGRRQNQNIGYSEAFLYGGISGIISWIFIYPQDRIKTILQSNVMGKSQTVKEVFKNIYFSGGFSQFYKGFSWAVARASLLHSGTFCMMEILNNHF